jgi:serine/threonine protein kinase
VEANRNLLVSMDDEALELGSAILLRDVLGHINDPERTAESPSFFHCCERARSRWAEHEDDAAARIAGLLGLICLNVRLLERRLKNLNPEEQEAADCYCRELLDQLPVKAAIYAVYNPKAPRLPPRSSTTEEGDDREPAQRAVELWEELDPESFSYFKAGTTSFILTCHRRDADDQSGYFEKLVLKGVLFPWSTIATIARSTADYATLYGRSAPGDEVVVNPIASTARWVVMPYLEGPTLFEYMEGAGDQDASSAHARIGRARHISETLVPALRQLGGQHLDLSPSNVILSGSAGASLIDLGVNYLYTRQVGIAEHDDSVYVAPEVKNRDQSNNKADVYSLGIILIEALSGQAPRDGRVPDSVYEMSPVLGMTLEDLIEENPDSRLLLMSRNASYSFDDLFGELRGYLKEAFESVEREPVASASRFRRLTARYAPASRELGTQFAKWRDQRAQEQHSDAAYLLLYSLVASVSWWFIAARTGLPEITDFVAELPHRPAWPTAAAVIAFAQGLMAAKYYQSILARLTVRSLPGRLARVTELAMRSMTVVALPTTLFAVSWRPSLWPWMTAIGAAAVAVTNLLTNILANRLFELGREARLSTMPPEDRPLPRGYEQWWWTMLIYAMVIAVIAVGLQEGWMQDEWAYVFGLLVINLGIHYVSKAALSGAAIRGGLARAFAAGERLRILHAGHKLDKERWPPQFRR